MIGYSNVRVSALSDQQKFKPQKSLSMRYKTFEYYRIYGIYKALFIPEFSPVVALCYCSKIIFDVVGKCLDVCSSITDEMYRL